MLFSSFADIQDHFEKSHGQIISISKAEDIYLDQPFPFTELLVCPFCRTSLHDLVSQPSTFLASDAKMEAEEMAKHISNHVHSIAFRLLDVHPLDPSNSHGEQRLKQAEYRTPSAHGMQEQRESSRPEWVESSIGDDRQAEWGISPKITTQHKKMRAFLHAQTLETTAEQDTARLDDKVAIIKDIYQLAEKGTLTEEDLQGSALSDFHSFNCNTKLTPLGIAVWHGHCQSAKLLLKYKADPDGGRNGRPPLWVATLKTPVYQAEGIIQLLLDYNADATLASQVSGDKATTPLWNAVLTRKSPRLISRLVDAGAIPHDTVPAGNKSAWQLARAFNDAALLSAMRPREVRTSNRLTSTTLIALVMGEILSLMHNYLMRMAAPHPMVFVAAFGLTIITFALLQQFIDIWFNNILKIEPVRDSTRFRLMVLTIVTIGAIFCWMNNHLRFMAATHPVLYVSAVALTMITFAVLRPFNIGVWFDDISKIVKVLDFITFFPSFPTTIS